MYDLTGKRAGGRRARRGGFTLIELLVVIMILSIIVALVVSFGSRVFGEAGGQTTRSTQEIIRNAINAYYDSEEDYPGKLGPPPAPPEPFEMVGDRYAHSWHLYDQLSKVEASRELIAKLPEEAIRDFGDGPVFLDGFGWVMDYSNDQAFGGRPLITSAGIDNDFDSDDDAEKDNIYSDGR